MGRESRNLAHFTIRAARDIDWIFEKGIEQQRLINIQGWTLNLNWSDQQFLKSKDKELT